MKRLSVIATMLLTCTSFAQTVVHVAGQTVFTVIGESLPWSQFAPNPAFRYALDSISSNSGGCILFHNLNTTNSRTVAVGAQIGAETFADAGSSGAGPYALFQRNVTVPASGWASTWINTSGAKTVWLNINAESGTAGGSPDTTDIFWTWTGQCPTADSVNVPNIGPSATVALPNQWTAVSAPATAAQATVTEAAIGGVRHTLVSIVGSVVQTGAVAVALDVFVTDGVNCSATRLWAGSIAVTNVAGNTANIGISGLQVTGTSGNAMTACFNAGAAGVNEAVTMTGFDQ